MPKGAGQGPGRPSKLTPETASKFIGAIKAGNHYKPACAYAGITYSCFRNWMQRGEAAKSGEYFDFFVQVTQAQAEAEVRAVAIINKASESDWRSASWLLERRFNKRWANTQRIELEAKKQVNEALGFILGSVSDSAKAEIASALAFTEHANQEADPEDQEGSDEDG